MTLKNLSETPDALPTLVEDHGIYLQQGGNPLLCRRCLHRVTTAEKMTTVSGSHQHVFTNPAGVTYQICCFPSAGGCVICGIPTAEFSWFSGYAWSIALCANCLLHIGWYYQSEKSDFFGLIPDHLLRKIKLH